jgi:protein-S-isoprenylcysteine O-methyltransferase Ste14
MTQTTAAIIWVVGMVLWFAIRYPHQRRARKQAVVRDRRDLPDRLWLWAAGLGLSILPLAHVLTGFPAFADHEFRPWMGWVGALAEAMFLAIFFESHRQLGKNWSITLEIRDKHRLVTDGIYRFVRHPMYTSFWLWAIAQAFLIPNWIAGLSGLVAVAGLYFSRVGKEERLMEEAFGEEYRLYSANTGRVIPRIF